MLHFMITLLKICFYRLTPPMASDLTPLMTIKIINCQPQQRIFIIYDHTVDQLVPKYLLVHLLYVTILYIILLNITINKWQQICTLDTIWCWIIRRNILSEILPNSEMSLVWSRPMKMRGDRENKYYKFVHFWAKYTKPLLKFQNPWRNNSVLLPPSSLFT